MKILLCDQRKCYLNLVIKKLKHYFKNTLQMSICMNAHELRLYDKQIISIAVIADKSNDFELLRMLRSKHVETSIIFIGDDYLGLHEIICIGVQDYLMIPGEIDILCRSVEKILGSIIKWSLPLKDTPRKHIFIIDEIKYVETSYNDMIIVTLTNQYFVIAIKNSCFLEIFLNVYFIKVNQSILVNLQCIDFITDNHVVLHSREVFPTSHNYKEEIKHAYRHC
ncbi:MAG: LytTR family transcriptional regulator [Erysipelotrichaceae bacterium]|nr:LytTR family transcriptional regulator [Erysipelotrichaceae bacterium]